MDLARLRRLPGALVFVVFGAAVVSAQRNEPPKPATINLVTRKPTKAFEAEGSEWTGGRSSAEGWNGYAMVGTRQPKFYAQGSANYANRDFWTLSGNYVPPARSLQPAGQRLSSDSSDSRYNVKAGWTPNDTDEYTVNYIKQLGEKGAPLNIYNNPPVPPNSYWRWPYWDVQNTSFLSKTQLGTASYVKTKAYYNTFANGLDAYDDATYTTQSLNGRFRSPYDDHAYGVSAELGTTPTKANTLKMAAHYSIVRNVDVAVGFKNLMDETYELAWGFPQPGRTFYVKTRFGL